MASSVSQDNKLSREQQEITKRLPKTFISLLSVPSYGKIQNAYADKMQIKKLTSSENHLSINTEY